MTSPFPKIAQILMLLLLAGWTRADGELFPLPAELEADVDFWVAIFSDYSSDEGVLHDSRQLSVVYERLAIAADAGRRERLRRVRERRRHYQSVLKTLAAGKRDELTAEERRVLGLWPEDVSNATLEQAAGRIRYQRGLADRFREGLQRAGRWRDHVHATFARLGVPLELAALPHVESSYNPNARSHVGASGLWQFTRGTGRRYMRIDHVLDERNDPYAATEAAGKLLAYNYSIAGNWPMAITAYNHGLSGVRRAMNRFGEDALVRILREYRSRSFGFASRNFYVAFLAALRIDRKPQDYFPGVVPDPPLAYERIRLPNYVPAATVAAAIGVSERELATHNPALQATIWQGSKHLPSGFELRMPAESLHAPLASLLTAVDGNGWYEEQLPDLYHRVARGDTLSEIAEAYRTRVSTLVALNNLGSRHRIRAGQRLRLPAAGPAPAVARAVTSAPQPEVAPPAAPEEAIPEITIVVAASEAGDAGEPDEAQQDAAVTDTMTDEGEVTMMGALQASLLSDPSDYSVAEDGTIEVQPLETLGHYADWLNIRTQRLRDLNGFAFRTPVEIGQRIELDLSRIDAATFEARRSEYQRRQQDSFFRQHTIQSVDEHVVRRGESAWVLALRRYDVPLWLFRQYNPELDMHNIRPGTRVRLPVLSVIES